MPQTMPRLALAVIASLSVTTGATAQVLTDTARIDPVVVTATRTPLAIGDLPASVTVLQGADLRARGIASVSEALRDVPGVAIARTGSFGAVTSVFVRGGQGSYTKVLVDGVAMNQPGGSFDWSTLTTDNVERIEIVRGPSSVVWGSDAVTGVVNVITRSGRGGARMAASARGGTYGSMDADAQVSHSSTAATYSVGLAHHRSTGIYDFNNASGNTVFSGRADAAINEKTDGSFTVRYSDAVAHYPTNGSGEPVDSNAFTTASQLAVSARLRRILTSHLSVQGSVTASAHDGGSDDAATQGGSSSFQSLDHITRRAAELRAIAPLGAGSVLTVGGQVEEQAHRGHSQSSFGTFTDASVFSAARHAQASFAELVSTRERATVTVGGRVDRNEKFGTFGTFRLAGQASIAGSTRLRASAGTAFREPSFFENYSTAYTTGNPDLDPEHTQSWEVGVSHGDAVRVQATYFDQRFRDMIDYDGAAAPGTPNYMNIARAQSRGVELEINHPPVHGVRFDLSFTRLETKVLDRGFSAAPTATLVEGQRLLRRPSFTGSAVIGYTGIRRLRADLAVSYVGDRDDRRFNPDFTTSAVTLPAYQLVDISAEYALPMAVGRPGISLTLRAANIGDARYETVSGYRSPGRVLLGGARVSY
ncbi:MAG TPA: TonB-dependent receptor [Gemmatimonadaceae bacterium]|nr:TonB-dependent receptor [Gemmatimonadaceae bacterium]